MGANMYEVLILLVLINLGFTGFIWRIVRRGPQRKFLAKFLNGKPITPKHTPSSLGNSIRITREDERFFSDFEMFADALNHRFEPNEPWRLQERPDAELTGREEQLRGQPDHLPCPHIPLSRCRFHELGQHRWFRITSAGRFSPLGPLGIVVLDLVDGIPGLAECNQNGFGEVHAFLITFRDLVPRCAMSRSRMIDEGSFDGARHNYETDEQAFARIS